MAKLYNFILLLCILILHLVFFNIQLSVNVEVLIWTKYNNVSSIFLPTALVFIPKISQMTYDGIQ